MERSGGTSEKRQWTSAHSQLWTAFKTSQAGRRETTGTPEEEAHLPSNIDSRSDPGHHHGDVEKPTGVIGNGEESTAHLMRSSSSARSPSQMSLASLSATSPFGSGRNDTARYQPIDESVHESALLTSTAYWGFEKLTKAIRLETEELLRDAQRTEADNNSVVFGFSEEVSQQIALHLGSATVSPEVKDLLHAMLNCLSCGPLYRMKLSEARSASGTSGSSSKELQDVLSLHSAAVGLETVLRGGGGGSRSRSGTRETNAQEQQQPSVGVPSVATVTERLRAMHDDASRAFEDLYAIYADIEAAVGNPVNDSEPIATSTRPVGCVSSRGHAHPDNILRLASQVRHGVSSVLVQWEKAMEAAPVGRSSSNSDSSTAALWSALKELSEILENGAEPCLSAIASATNRDRRDESTGRGRSGEGTDEEYQRRLLLASLPSLALRLVRELEGERRRVHRLNIVSSLYERNVCRRFAELGMPPAHIPTLAAENAHFSTTDEEDVGTNQRVTTTSTAAGAEAEERSMTSSSSCEDNWIIDSIRELEAVVTSRNQESLRHMEQAFHASSFSEEHKSDGLTPRNALQGSTNASVARDVRHYVRTILYCAGKELAQSAAPTKTSEAPQPTAAVPPASTESSSPPTTARPSECEARAEANSVPSEDVQQSRTAESAEKMNDNNQMIERAMFRLAQLLPTGIQPRTYPGGGEAAVVEPPVATLDAMIDLLESRLEVWRQQVHKQATHSASRRLDQARFEEKVKARSLGILSVLQSITTMSYAADCGEPAPGDEEADEEIASDYDRRRDEADEGGDTASSKPNAEKKPEVSADVLDLLRSTQSKERGNTGVGSCQTQGGADTEQRRFGASSGARSPVQASVADTLEDVEERVRLLATQYSKATKLNTSNKTRLRNLQSSLDAYQRRWTRIVGVVVPICEALKIDGSALKVKSSHFSSASAIRPTVTNSDTLPWSKKETSYAEGQREASAGTFTPSIGDVPVVEVLENCLESVIKLSGNTSPSKATKVQRGGAEESATVAAPSSAAAVADKEAPTKPDNAESDATAAALRTAEAELQRVRESSKLDREMFQAALEVILERLGEAGKLVKKVLFVMGTDESAEDDLVERVVKRKPLESSATAALSREEKDQRHAETEDFLAVLLQKFGRWSTRLHETMEDHLFTQKRLLQYYAAVYHYIGSASSGDAGLPPSAATLLSRVKTVDNLIDIDGVMSKFADGILPTLDRAIADQNKAQGGGGPATGKVAALLNAHGLRAEPFFVFDHRLVRICEAVGKLRKVIQTLMRVHYLTVPSKGPARSGAKGSSSRKRKDDLVFLSDTEQDDGFVEIDLGKIQEEVLAALSDEREPADKAASASSSSSSQRSAANLPVVPKPPKTEVQDEDVEDEFEDAAEVMEPEDVEGAGAAAEKAGTTASNKHGELDTDSLFRIVEKNIGSVMTTTSRFSSNYKLATILVQKDMESIQQNLERMLAKYSELDVEKAFAQDREELHELYQVIHDRRTRQRGCYFFNRPDGAGSCIWSLAVERLAVGFDAIVEKLVQRTQMAKRYRDILNEAMDASVAHINWAMNEAKGASSANVDVPPSLFEKCLRDDSHAGVEGETNQGSQDPQPVTQLQDERTFLELFTFLISRAEQPPKQLPPPPPPAVQVLDEADDRLQVLREQLAVAEEKLRNGTEELSKVEVQRDLALSDAAIARAELRRFKRTIEAASENRTLFTSTVNQSGGALNSPRATTTTTTTTPPPSLPHAVRTQSPRKSDDYNRPLTVGELRSMFDHLFSHGSAPTDAYASGGVGAGAGEAVAEAETDEAPATTRTPVSAAQKARHSLTKPGNQSSQKKRSPQRGTTHVKGRAPSADSDLRKTLPHRVEGDEPMVFVSPRRSYASSAREPSPQYEVETSPQSSPLHRPGETRHYSPKQFNNARFNECDTCVRRQSAPAGAKGHAAASGSMRQRVRGSIASVSGGAAKRSSPSRADSAARSPSRRSSNSSQGGEHRHPSPSVASSNHTQSPSSLTGYYADGHAGTTSTPPLQRTPTAGRGDGGDARNRRRVSGYRSGELVSTPPAGTSPHRPRRAAAAGASKRPGSPEILPDLSDLLSSLTPLRRNPRGEGQREPMIFGSGEAKEARQQRSYAKSHRYVSPPLMKRGAQRKGACTHGTTSAEDYQTPPPRNPYRSNPNLMSEGLQSLANAVTRTRVSSLMHDEQF